MRTIDLMAEIMADTWMEDGGTGLSEKEEVFELMTDYITLLEGNTHTKQFEDALVRLKARELFAKYQSRKTLTRMMKKNGKVSGKNS